MTLLSINSPCPTVMYCRLNLRNLVALRQQLKLSLQSSSALGNLTGKLPELPLEYEGKFSGLTDVRGETK